MAIEIERKLENRMTERERVTQKDTIQREE